MHDYIKEYGGAERVLEALHEIYPRAPVYTTVFLPEFLGPHKDRFKNWNIHTSWLQYIPFKEKLISLFRIVAPLIFSNWDFSKYDVVVVSATGAYTPNLIRKGRALHLCYCHTPPRFLYGYPTAREWKNNVIYKVLGEITNHILRMIDFKSAQNVDCFIANSKNIVARIKKFYRREAVVIYPPVVVGKIKQARHNAREYFLAGGRLARPKRVDLAVVACTKLSLPLKVFGKEFAGYGDELRKLAGANVEFLGEVTEEEKWELMAGAKAFIFPAEEEDFGITPVEAMACGTPVIALRSGGVVESVILDKTGLFFDQPNTDSLVNALRQFETKQWDRAAIARYAQRFNKERFKREISAFVKQCLIKENKKLATRKALK